MAIRVFYPGNDPYTGEIVATALIRSFSDAQVQKSTYADVGTPCQAAVFIEPGDEARDLLHTLLSQGGKALVLGRPSLAIAENLGIALADRQFDSGIFNVEIDPARHHDATAGQVVYTDHPFAACSPYTSRPFGRFDFADEWNNLGFGRVSAAGPWGLAVQAEAAEAKVIAWAATDRGKRVSAYATLLDRPSGSVLWFNRPVGPVDSLEWTLVEHFFANYRADELPAFPCLVEIPFGFQAAASPRIDCDEAVFSGRELFELYRDLRIPFSMAIATGQPLGHEDMRLMRDVIAAGGSVVSHSVHHYAAWGGSYELALAEAMQSKTSLEQHVSNAKPMRHAVSPFHQNPSYAVRALADAGYVGFVGGIIANDPEYLLGRAGRVPFEHRMVSHSQQCMLHGDCVARYGNSVDVYQQSFDQHRQARSIFGYLDHPFSPRYQYGWADERARLAAHEQLVAHVAGRADTWWASTGDVLGFLAKRDRARIGARGSQLLVEGVQEDSLPPLAIQWKGREHAA